MIRLFGATHRGRFGSHPSLGLTLRLIAVYLAATVVCKAAMRSGVFVRSCLIYQNVSLLASVTGSLGQEPEPAADAPFWQPSPT
jgi:hypothetical protein